MRFILAIVLIFAVSVPAHSEDRLPSAFLSQSVLEECDRRAKGVGHYPEAIRAAIDGLIDIGAFTDEDFHDVKIGFCSLRREKGPVATTSCAHDTILFDTNYTIADQSLPLQVTLAHEMKHYFQHRQQKAQLGNNYCASNQYVSDKSWMEEEADQFGDDLAGLLFVGRPIEIENTCDVPVQVYLDEFSVQRDVSAGGPFISAPPNTTVEASASSRSRHMKFYARAETNNNSPLVWQDRLLADTRIIEGKRVGLKDVILTNRSRTDGPFVLSLSCL